MRPNRSIWEGNWKVRRQTRTWEKQEQCLCTAHRAVPQIPKSCGTGQTGNQPGCVTTGPTSVGTEGADPAFPATLPCRKLGTFLPSVFPSRNGSTSLLHSYPTLLPVHPSNPIYFPHTCPRRNGKVWKFHPFVVINIHNIFTGINIQTSPQKKPKQLSQNLLDNLGARN